MRTLGLLSFALLLGGCATTADSAGAEQCYDLKVRAKPVAQVPTVYPKSDDPNVIVMSWPWFVDLEISRVLDGEFEASTLTALAVLHTYYISDSRTWYLRENTAGTYNILRPSDPSKVGRCGVRTYPTEPYIRPGEGQSYEDLRREGEDRYNRYYQGDE